MDRDRRRQQPVSPGVTEVRANALDPRRLQMHRDIRLDLRDRAQDTGDHPWSPGGVVVSKHHLPGDRAFRSASTSIRTPNLGGAASYAYLRGIRDIHV